MAPKVPSPLLTSPRPSDLSALAGSRIRLQTWHVWGEHSIHVPQCHSDLFLLLACLSPSQSKGIDSTSSLAHHGPTWVLSVSYIGSTFKNMSWICFSPPLLLTPWFKPPSSHLDDPNSLTSLPAATLCLLLSFFPHSSQSELLKTQLRSCHLPSSKPCRSFLFIHRIQSVFHNRGLWALHDPVHRSFWLTSFHSSFLSLQSSLHDVPSRCSVLVLRAFESVVLSLHSDVCSNVSSSEKPSFTTFLHQLRDKTEFR